MEEITKAQEDILKALWKIDEGAVSDVLNVLPAPKPAYTTVATVIKVLEKKGYISHKTFGKTNVYFPVVSKKRYSQNVMKDTLKGLFNGSFNQMFSAFVKSKDIGVKELEEMKQMLENELNNKKD